MIKMYWRGYRRSIMRWDNLLSILCSTARVHRRCGCIRLPWFISGQALKAAAYRLSGTMSTSPYLPPPFMPPPSSPHPPEEPHSASHCDEGSSSNVQLFFGIVVHVCGSVGINTGQNLQAIALSKLSEEEKKQPWKSKGWAIGCAIFISCSILNFVALTLAPASILVPLESVQFVTNVLFGKFVRKIEIPLAMWMGVLCMILGTALAVVFGAAEAYCFSLDVLISYWGMKEGWAWWLYIAITFAISVVCLVAHSKYEKATKAGKPLKWQKQLQPVAFAVPSALLGGAQMIVHSKTLAELAELAFAEGQTEILTEGFFWISLLLVSGFGIFWFYRLTVCLGMYDPLFIIPLMQAREPSSQRKPTPPAAPPAPFTASTPSPGSKPGVLKPLW